MSWIGKAGFYNPKPEKIKMKGKRQNDIKLVMLFGWLYVIFTLFLIIYIKCFMGYSG